MKKREIVCSDYINNGYQCTGKKVFNGFSGKRKIDHHQNPYSSILNYNFYTDTKIDSNCTIQFKKLHEFNNVYKLTLAHPQSSKKEPTGCINSIYIPSHHPTEAIAQIIVDFMISQYKVKLIIEGDLQPFKLALKKFWTEYNALFNITGLRNGCWDTCNEHLAYDAFILTR